MRLRESSFLVSSKSGCQLDIKGGGIGSCEGGNRTMQSGGSVCEVNRCRRGNMRAWGMTSSRASEKFEIVTLVPSRTSRCATVVFGGWEGGSSDVLTTMKGVEWLCESLSVAIPGVRWNV